MKGRKAGAGGGGGETTDPNRTRTAKFNQMTAKSLFKRQTRLFPVSSSWALPEAGLGLGLCIGAFCKIPLSQNPNQAQLPPRNYILMT